MNISNILSTLDQFEVKYLISVNLVFKTLNKKKILFDN